MDPEIPVAGGRLNRGSLVRTGDIVLRPTKEDPRIERLIFEVGKVFSAMPRSFGRDEKGRLKLEWIEGDADEVFDDDIQASEKRLRSVGALLRQMHDATSAIVSNVEVENEGYVDPSAIHEVICHGDPGPGNVVFRQDIAFALIDWELAAPGRRIWDLAIALRYWAPIRHPDNLRSYEKNFDWRERGGWLLDGYRASKEMRIACAELLPLSQELNAKFVIRRMMDRGDAAFDLWVSKGGLERIGRDADWIGKTSVALAHEWRSASN